ncbi:MAG TPA: TlpA disulfide reductase family protein [Candidatus Cybelea sp.]|jgi:thiol-disulfide isomerase/thioredoxin|nr:TlpA disulfide reductase family protein [Candidatus Cybelea sp.]
MTRRVATYVTLAIIIAIVAAAALYYRMGGSHGSVQTASQAPIVGKALLNKTAPEFEVATTSGFFDLSKTRKPVFLEVFATWCPHCQRETAVIDKLYAKYHNSVEFVGVSGSNTAMDGTSDSSELDVLEWIRKFNVRYPVAYDPLLNVANLYLQGGFPTIALIDAAKKIRYLGDGEITYGELDSALKKVLSS